MDYEYLYVFDTRQERVVYKFKRLLELLAHYVDYLYNEYDDEGRKIHPNKRYKDIPALYHETQKIF